VSTPFTSLGAVGGVLPADAVAPNGEAAAGVGNYAGAYANQAGLWAVNHLAARITTPGCSDVGAFQMINAALDSFGGVTKAALTGAAFLADPIAGYVTAGIIGSFQEGTEGGCGTPTPKPLATTKSTGPLLPAIQAGPTVPLTISGLTAGQADQLLAIFYTINEWGQNFVHPFYWNPAFWMRNMEVVPGHGAAGPSYVQVANFDVSTPRLDGESSVDWLNRLLPDWEWSVRDNGFVYSIGGGVDDIDLGGCSFIWPWDGLAKLGPNASWQADFSKYYKFEIEPGVFWSQLGFLAGGFAAAGFVARCFTDAPIAVE
jgi:hypothetical protein